MDQAGPAAPEPESRGPGPERPDPDAPVDPWAGADGSPDAGPDATAHDGAPGSTQPGASGPEPALDETAADVPPVGPGGPGVVPPVGPGGTGVLPAVPPEPPKWSARASVRPRDVEDGLVDGDEWSDSAPPRGAFFPVLMTVSVMILLALIGLGVWLLVRGTGSPPPPLASATTTTSAHPTTTPPPTTTKPPTTAPVMVSIPDLAGKDYAAAAAALQTVHLVATKATEHSDLVPAGQFVRAEPAVGSPVPVGSTVIVVISLGSATPTPTAEPTTPTESPS